LDIGPGDNSVVIDNVTIAEIATADDGRDEYMVHFAAPTNTLRVRNSQFRGLLSNNRVHGIDNGANTMGEKFKLRAP
jgi:hypothetical protein